MSKKCSKKILLESIFQEDCRNIQSLKNTDKTYQEKLIQLEYDVITERDPIVSKNIKNRAIGQKLRKILMVDILYFTECSA